MLEELAWQASVGLNLEAKFGYHLPERSLDSFYWCQTAVLRMTFVLSAQPRQGHLSAAARDYPWCESRSLLKLL